MSSIIERLPDAVVPGLSLKIIIPAEFVKVLRETRFRGKEVARAGNSYRWNSPEEMVKDPLFRERFAEVIADSVRDNWPALLENFEETVTLPFGVPVGWVTVLPREKINGARIAPGRITPTLRGMLVALDDAEHPAPLGNLLTMKLSMRVDFKDRSSVAVRVLDMHMGEDLGRVEGDLTGPFRLRGELKPRKFVFFHPDHPGGDEYVALEP
jgi:hypothetical protein